MRYPEQDMKKTKYGYGGAVGDDACVAVLNEVTGRVAQMQRAVILASITRTGVAMVLAELPGERKHWFARKDGSHVTTRGTPVQRSPDVLSLVGPWLDAYGTDGHVLGEAACEEAMRRGAGVDIVDPRQQAIAGSVTAICALFGVGSDSLRERLVADETDTAALAHNGLRKFAVGAIAHLAHEVDVAWSGRGGGVAKQGLRAVSEVPQLRGIHRGTLGRFREQFAVFAGLGIDAAGRVREPLSDIGRFARDRYCEIRKAAVSAAATAIVAGQPADAPSRQHDDCY